MSSAYFDYRWVQKFVKRYLSTIALALVPPVCNVSLKTPRACSKLNNCTMETMEDDIMGYNVPLMSDSRKAVEGT